LKCAKRIDLLTSNPSHLMHAAWSTRWACPTSMPPMGRHWRWLCSNSAAPAIRDHQQSAIIGG